MEQKLTVDLHLSPNKPRSLIIRCSCSLTNRSIPALSSSFCPSPLPLSEILKSTAYVINRLSNSNDTVAFKVYDMDRDGFISNGELYLVLKQMVGNNLKVRLQSLLFMRCMSLVCDAFSSYCHLDSLRRRWESARRRSSQFFGEARIWAIALDCGYWSRVGGQTDLLQSCPCTSRQTCQERRATTPSSTAQIELFLPHYR